MERLYRLDEAPDVREFLLEEGVPVRAAASRQPPEQVFVAADGDDLCVGVYLEGQITSNIERRDPSRHLDDTNLRDVLLAVEAVSHYLCIIHCARSRRPVRPVELEHQAEVDKYLVCLLLLEQQGSVLEGLAQRLDGALRLADNLDADERARYAAAGELATSYAQALEGRYVVSRPRRFAALLEEVRHFYRLTLDGKRDRILALAA